MHLIERWMAADFALADGDAAAARAALPPRLRWLHRALEALEDGRVDVLRALADEAREGAPDVAALLTLVADDPAEDEARLAQPAASAASAPAAALLEALRTRRPPEAPAPDPRERPALAAAHALLGALDARVSANPVLAGRLPRAEQVRVAAHFVLTRGVINNATLERAFPQRLVDFDPARWPDLAPRVDPGEVTRWARGDGPWGRHLAVAVASAAAADEATRARLLGALLRRLERDVAAGRLRGLEAPARAALSLATSLGLETLRAQLTPLALRLRWIEDGAPPGELLEAAWVHARGLSRDERLRVAGALLAQPPAAPHPDVMIESQLFLMAHLPDVNEAAGVLEAGGREAPRELIDQGLRRVGASEARRRHIVGLHAALDGDLAAAADAARALALDDAADAAQSVLFNALTTLDAGPGAAPPADAAEALGAALEALSGRALDGALLPLLLSVLRGTLGVPGALRAPTRRALEGLGDAPRDLAMRVLCLAMIDDEAAARDALRRLGRDLRAAADADAADARALEALAWMAFWAHRDDRALVEPLITPLARFLLRRGPEHAAAVVARVARDSDALRRGALRWYLWQRASLGEDRRWLDLAAQAVQMPEAVGALGVRIVRGALDAQPADLDALRAQVHATLGALVRGEQTPDDLPEAPSEASP